jgi:hypothetical protein
MKRLLKAARFIRVAIIAFSAAGVGYANSIPIANASFEVTVVGLGGTSTLIPGWTQIGTSSTYGPTATQFPGGVPNGSNVAAVDYGASISQTLAATLTAGIQYALVVSVGQRADYSLSGYLISFDAGGNLLASVSSPIPAPGTFTAVTVSFLALPNNPYLGEALSIILATTGYNQAEFDAVSLDGPGISTAPEPGTWVLMLTGLALVGATARRKAGIKAA